MVQGLIFGLVVAVPFIDRAIGTFIDPQYGDVINRGHERRPIEDPVRAAIGQDSILYVVNQGDSTVSIVSQLGGQFTVAEKTLSVGFNPLGIAVLPDGSKLYLVLQEDSVIEVFGYE